VTRTTDARTIAIEVLERVDDGAWSNLVLPTTLRRSALDDRDRAFATDLVYGTLRLRRQCDHLLGLASNRPVARLDRPVRAALRLGVYQLVAGVAPHAAVSATVDAVGRRSPRARGFVNAVLRKAQTLGPPWPWPAGDATRDLAVRLSYPDWIVERLTTDLGAADAAAALATMNEPAAVTLRPNPRRTTVDALREDLEASGVAIETGSLVPDALVARGTGDPAALPAVRDGRATPQDETSQAVVGIVDPALGARVLDLAAGPGGKATALAERAGEDGVVVAFDVSPARVGLVARAARRLGVDGIVQSVAGDAFALPLAPTRAFGSVLVDAPCSGLGVLRRRAEARWRIEPDAVGELAALQRRLLAAGAACTEPGGVLVYSVCTLTRAETIAVDEWAAAELPEFVAEPIGPGWRPWGRGGLVLPHDHGTDGMFVLRLRRVLAGGMSPPP